MSEPASDLQPLSAPGGAHPPVGEAPGPHRPHGFHLDLPEPHPHPGAVRQPLRRQGLLRPQPPLLSRVRARTPRRPWSTFLKEAGRRDLKVMLDLVINHTAIDSPLVREHPEWYAKDEHGQIKHPGAIDPADATPGDGVGRPGGAGVLAAPGPRGPAALLGRGAQPSIWAWVFWASGPMRPTRSPGTSGTASSPRPGTWSPGSSFSPKPWAAAWRSAPSWPSSGFDFLYNSSKWWDFQADWCLEQYEMFRRLAPSISFPGEPRHRAAGRRERRRPGGGPPALPVRRLLSPPA